VIPNRRPGDPPCILLNTTIINQYEKMLLPFISGMTTLFLCPEEFDLPHHQKVPEFRYVEASIDLLRKQTGAFPWDRVDQCKKLLYCSLGTQSHWSHQGTNHELHQRTLQSLLQAVVKAMAARPDWQLI